MQINNILAGYSDPAAPGKRAEPTEKIAGSMLAELASQAQPKSAPSAELRHLFAQYDVTDITPREFSEMLRELYDLGAISDQELQSLALVRTDLDKDGVDPDRSVNLVEYYAAKLQEAQKSQGVVNDKAFSENRASAGEMQRRLDWMKKLALIQSAPEELGLDLAA